MKRIGYGIALILALALGFWLGGFWGAGGPPSGMPGMPGAGMMQLPAVVAQELKERPLDVQDEYIASVEPVQEVAVRTEVPGYIETVHFVEGAYVNAGDLLFTIDQRTYKAKVTLAQASVALATSSLPGAQANLESAQANQASAQAALESEQANFERADAFLKRLRNADQRSVVQADMDTATADVLQAQAQVQRARAAIQQAQAAVKQAQAQIQQTGASIEQAKADLTLANINLAFTEVQASIAGRIGKAIVTKGNYVTSATGALAQIVQTDPIRVVFSMTDSAYLDLHQQALAGQTKALAAHIRLPNGSILKTVGQKDFDDNAMNRDTGTVAVRYLFDNPDGLLISGGYVNILLGQPERPLGIRIPQQAVLVDPQGTYVLTVDDAGKVGSARIELGKSIETDFVVLSGLQAGDRIVVDGLQKVQPGSDAKVTLQELTP
jgi:RND family efflux transporter MFP subunit